MLKRLTPRNIKWIFSNEIDAVAAYMGANGISFFLDRWTSKCWGAFMDKHFKHFIEFLAFDVNVSIIHEIIHKNADRYMAKHCGVSPEYPDAWNDWEEYVEYVAREMASQKISGIFVPCIEIDNGDK